MNRALFFTSVRARTSGIFGTSLSAKQVQGCEALLDACEKFGVTDQHHVAEVLAEAYHETGGYMLPIKETVMRHHKDKLPSDAVVISRLNTAYAKGQLPWVKTIYWRDGWFGRGPVQTTHRDNYKRVGAAIGVDLVANRDRILEPAIGAAAAVVGLRDGIYTGKKLADFDYDVQLSLVGKTKSYGPRRIVNGKDGTDEDIAAYHRAFYNALSAAGYAEPARVPVPVPKPVPAPPVAESKPVNPGKLDNPATIERQPVSGGWLAGLVSTLLAALKGNAK